MVIEYEFQSSFRMGKSNSVDEYENYDTTSSEYDYKSSADNCLNQ
jgi:hypothetical protein